MSIVLPPISTPFVDKQGRVTQPWYRYLFQENFVLNAFRAEPAVFAELPAFPVQGQIANITDADTGTWGANVTATGAFNVLAWYNGTNWTVIGV